ncbi:MAG: hypothetical protein OXR84_01660 [Magnetovibrio sp.]|nr:hypothetical protein [Magnetovibrio sp.]
MRRIAALGLAAALLGAAPLSAQQSTYSQWHNPDAAAPNERLQEFIDKLNALVDKAEKARAADPNFLRDLRDLATGFDRPWRTRLFDDDFLDGDFTANPAWRVASGKYWIERGWGLRSAVDAGAQGGGGQSSQTQSSEQKAAKIFGQILSQVLTQGQGGESGGTAGASGAGAAAAISTATPITNAFALETDFSSWQGAGRLVFSVYQGAFRGTGSSGYHVIYTPGGGIELQRTSSRGTSVIERAQAPTALEDKKIDRLAWERHPNGRMTVSVDGKQVLDANDRGVPR